jgi:alpha-galactosidase
MEKRIVLVGAGSASFGPPTLVDLNVSKVLSGSTIVLHDINEEKLNMVYEIITEDNKRLSNKFNIERTIRRSEALKDADFVISSTENGDRFKLRWQDNTIPRKHGSTEMMAENGGPGGFFHSARQIPEIVRIAKDVERICPDAFLMIYSNPLSRICLAVKRAVPNLKSVGLCHQLGLLGPHHLIRMLNREMKDLRLTTGGLNHFAFLLGLKDVNTGEDLMPEFNSKCTEYFREKWNRFHYADLTFEVYKRFGYFPYVGDNHICEYLQIGSQYTKVQDLIDWITRMEQSNKGMNAKLIKYYKRLKKGSYPRRGMFSRDASGERAIPVIEAIVQDKKSYEMAVNIPNDGIIDNLPQDLIIECSATVDKNGIHGVKLGNIPKNIAAILRIEASIQDVCVDAILKESKDMAIACLAMDVNCGSFEMAEAIYDEMIDVQKVYLPNFK